MEKRPQISFISNSRYTIIFMALALIISFTLLLSWLEPYTAYKTNKATKDQWSSFYKSPDDFYDTYILGSSHAGASFNPRILDRALATKTLNLFTSDENIAKSYYHLKEIYRLKNPKNIILELYKLYPDTEDVLI